MIPVLLAAALLAQAPAPPAPPPRPPTAAAPAERGLLLGEWPGQPSGKRVTLDDKMTVDEALEQIADAARWNLVANTGAAGDRVLILSLRNAPVEEALEAVLEGTPLAATRRGDTVTVAPALARRAETPVLTGFDTPSGKRFSGDFADAPVDEALRKIADAAGLSVVFPPGLRGAVTAHFKNTPVEDALRAVLGQSGLAATREGTVLTVARESGPRVVISGGRRRMQFQLEVPDGQGVRELAEQAAEAARQAAGVEIDVEGRGGRGHDRISQGDIALAAGERARDVVALRGDVRLGAGAVARQVTAVLGSVDLGPGSVVEKEVVAIGGDVHVSPGAHVGQDAVSVGGKLVIDPGGVVQGDQQSIAIPGLTGLLSMAMSAFGLKPYHSPLLYAGQVLSQFAMFFALGLVVLVFFPRRLDAVAASLGQAPAKATLVGLVGTLAQPILALLLVVTVVGIPLVAVQVVAVLVAGLLGFTALALFVGRRLPLRVEKGLGVLQLAVGTALVVVVVNVPVLGCLAGIVAWLAVFGAVLLTRFGRPDAAAPAGPAAPAEAAPPAAPAS